MQEKEEDMLVRKWKTMFQTVTCVDVVYFFKEFLCYKEDSIKVEGSRCCDICGNKLMMNNTQLD